jgi:membrane fusion protein (multidrug efflux system)
MSNPELSLRRRVALPALLLLSLTGCGDSSGPARGADAASVAPVGVAVAPAVMLPLAFEIEAVGTALARESVDITSRWANTVVALHFREGGTVRRGAVLVEFDGAELRAELAAARAALAESESQYKRSRELFATQALSQAQLDQIEATLLANRARVAAAEARLADTVIRAPFDGRTGLRHVSVGAFVAPGTVITTLDDDAAIKLDFTVPQAAAQELARGLAVVATATGLGSRRIEGRVETLDSRVDPVTRALTVRALLPNGDGAIRPGMFMSVRLQGAAAPALVVPEAALVPERGVDYVFVVAAGKVLQRKVTVGRRQPGRAEIVAGLAAGERVVVEGTHKIRDGVPVTEVPALAGG